MDNNELVKDILLDLHKSSAVVQSDIAAMKADLKEHMRRTHILEATQEILKRDVNMAKGAVALLTFSSVVLGILKYLGKI